MLSCPLERNFDAAAESLTGEAPDFGGRFAPLKWGDNRQSALKVLRERISETRFIWRRAARREVGKLGSRLKRAKLPNVRHASLCSSRSSF